MKSNGLRKLTIVAVGIAGLFTFIAGAQPPAGGQGRGGGGRGAMFAPAFTAFDMDKDGMVTREEMKSVFDSWFTSWDTAKSGALTQKQIKPGLSSVFPAPPAQPGGMSRFNPAGNTTPLVATQSEVDAMMAALPGAPGAKPAKARKVLVFGHTGAGGFVHGSIPLAAKTVEALGAQSNLNQGKLWTTDVSYDPKDINTANLKQYDAIFLDSTTSCFLDDEDPAVTASRRAAFLDFVRNGKGIASIHAATDSYHSDCAASFVAAKRAVVSPLASALATQFPAQGDKNNDRGLTRAEFAALAETWFEKLDTEKNGKVSRADFDARFPGVAMGGPGGGGGRGGAEAAPILQWTEFNRLIGGYFKYHWPDPQLITVKIDDVKSPLTSMFHGRDFEIRDETYTFAQDSFSRTNAHVLTSIDYEKMTAADRAKEPNPRSDGDYALSYIRREGKGRVFYEGHGHSARVYAMTPMLEHIRAGIQYALGDLKADDSPSKK